CDGHDFADIRRALAEAAADPRPSLVACRTIIGFGAPNKQGTSATHGSPLGAGEVAAARAELGWTSEPFVVPADIAAAWKSVGARGAEVRSQWQERLSSDEKGAVFSAQMAGDVDASTIASAYIAELMTNPAKVATRKASEMALGPLTAGIPALVGGSADLTGSNNTKTASTTPLTADDYAGRYLYYGIREFGMAAAMNGMALHGGIIPYGGTFLVFSDYCRGAIRLSALQQVRVVYVLTHDSIGLGEDGPTHQPIEHIMSMRLIPNLAVYRPCDAVETAECWALAIEDATRPSVLALTRQNLPQLRHDNAENRSARGAYRLRDANAARRVVIIATGSEVEIAISVADRLELHGIGADVVSMPCWERFDAQDAAYRNDVLPSAALRVSIEAGTTIGWERYVGGGLRFGIDEFGASAPAEDLYRHFGLTADAIAPHIISELEGN
ncbi:MAG: transketolase-like TK C-terminal-containing protein, partial [Sphingopyxis sp.]